MAVIKSVPWQLGFDRGPVFESEMLRIRKALRSMPLAAVRSVLEREIERDMGQRCGPDDRRMITERIRAYLGMVA
jgi:hypothetical protein